MPVLEELERQSDDRFLAIYEGLSNNGFGPLDGEVAKALKFRPQAIRKLPMAKRARQARSILQRTGNTELCYEVFGTYLVTKHKELVTTFLDETGVEHEDGMIQNMDSLPDDSKLEAAIAKLDEAFDRDDVTLYLALAAEQWAESSKLKSLWEGRAK